MPALDGHTVEGASKSDSSHQSPSAHSDVIEINEESAENLVGESHSVVGNIFNWIEEVDKKHFDEMVEVAEAV